MNDLKPLTATELAAMCYQHGIQKPADAIHMHEYDIGGGRLDLITIDLKRFIIRGFEIKLKRKDFLSDVKWQTYLSHLNFFYFVTPEGVIEKGELPPEVFHIEVRETEDERDLVVVKRGRRLQPKFVRETYGEQFFHRLLMEYVRNIRWRSRRLGNVCKKCGERLAEDPAAAVRGVQA